MLNCQKSVIDSWNSFKLGVIVTDVFFFDLDIITIEPPCSGCPPLLRVSINDNIGLFLHVGKAWLLLQVGSYNTITSPFMLATHDSFLKLVETAP